jgi:hypothetical protein
MKKLPLLVVALIFGWLSVAQAQVWVDPYTRRDGTQVQGHYRSNPYKQLLVSGKREPLHRKAGHGRS